MSIFSPSANTISRLLGAAAAALALLSASGAGAQTPSTINIQGSLQDAAGAPLTGTRAYRVRFFDSESGSVQLGSSQTGDLTLSSKGRFSVAVTPPAEVLSASEAWYELAIDTDGVSGIAADDIFPQRSRVHSVPFALKAAELATPGTLDGAYDAGGSGEGRTIVADSGSVLVEGDGGIEAVGFVDSVEGFQARGALQGVVHATLFRGTGGGEIQTTDESAVQTMRGGSSVNAGGFFDLNQANGNLGLTLDGDNTNASGGGSISLKNPSGAEVMFASRRTSNGGQMGVRNSSGNTVAFMTDDSTGDGFFAVARANGTNSAIMEVNSAGSGQISTLGRFGGQVTAIGDNNADGGFVGVQNPNGVFVVALSTVGSGGSQQGFIGVNNGSGGQVAGIDGSNGEVFGNFKSFVVPDPRRSDRMIRYASLEGPEAALYARGKARLENGRATVAFPDHFALLAAPETLTVTLTPRSAASKGLAAVEVTPEGLSVAELAGGTGSYEFDYMACAVRKGHEDFEVSVDAKRYQPFGLSSEPRKERPAAPAPNRSAD